MADAITPEELKSMLDSDRKPTVFDVRRRADFEAAPQKIGPAVWHDPEKADEWIGDVPADRPVIVYCVKGGTVSQSIADRLEQRNREVKFLQGGIKAWAESGEPVVD
jgi:rhodanese-related sulfurtransferase